VEERPSAPLGEIKVIVGGSALGRTSKTLRREYLHKVKSVQITRRPPKQCRMEDFPITFIDDDA